MDEADFPVSRGHVPGNSELPALQVLPILADIMAPLAGIRDAMVALDRPQVVDDQSRNMAALAFVARAAADAHRKAADRLDELAAEAASRLRAD